jgi:DNA-binding transcriptional regulator YdaS (Cro superfamily)
MTLSEYFKSEPLGSIAEMADHLGLSRVWMSKLIHKRSQPSIMLAIRIQNATQGLVTKEELRPDVFLV